MRSRPGSVAHRAKAAFRLRTLTAEIPLRVVNEIMRPVLGILTMSALHPQPVMQLETLGSCVPAKSRYAFDAAT
jgi:hypothetical protein